jgi:hypothetical protein
MNRIVRIPAAKATVLAVAMTLVLIPLSACSGGDEEAAAAMAAERQAGLEALEQQQQEVQQVRDEVADLREQRLAAASDGESDADPTELATRIETRNADLSDMSDAYNQALTEFINADPPVADEPVPEATARAIAMKADADILLAKEYITEAGDYARAISMYDAILTYSPDNPNVLEAKAEAESLRYMTEERFSQVEKGMTETEVENLLGRANLRNRRDYEAEGRAAWYYPKSEDGDAAGIFFQKRDGRLVVYDVKWDAVAKRAEGEEEAA